MNNVSLFLFYLGMSALSAAMLSLSLRTSRRVQLLPLFLALCTLIPLLGQLGVWTAVVLPLRNWRKTVSGEVPELTELPSLPADPPDVDRVVTVEPVRAVVAYGRESTVRMKALTRTSRWDDRSAVPALLVALKDHVDDIRLLAYGLLDGRLQKAMRRISSAERARATSTPETTALLERQIAFESWELVRSGLLRGAAADQALTEALQRAESALLSGGRDVALHFLRGRILLRKRDPKAAEALREGVRCGLPICVVGPYLAEEAFLRGAFHEVPGFLAHGMKGHTAPKVSALCAFWLSSVDPELHLDIPLRDEQLRGDIASPA